MRGAAEARAGGETTLTVPFPPKSARRDKLACDLGLDVLVQHTALVQMSEALVELRDDQIDALVRLGPSALVEQSVELIAHVLAQVGALDEVQGDQQPLGRRQDAVDRDDVRVQADDDAGSREIRIRMRTGPAI